MGITQKIPERRSGILSQVCALANAPTATTPSSSAVVICTSAMSSVEAEEVLNHCSLLLSEAPVHGLRRPRGKRSIKN